MAKYRTGRKAPIVDLTKILKEMLEEYGEEVRQEAGEVLTELAPEITEQVASKSPVGNDPDHYKAGWTAQRKVDSFGQTRVIVCNENKPTLTHLLEFGHRGYPLKNGGRTRDVKGIPHIKPASKWAEEEAVKRLERKLKE